MLGDNIRKIRKARGFSINKLSKMAGVSLGYLSDLENNKSSNPTTETLEKLASALEVSLSDFFDSSTDSDRKIIDDINKIVEKNKVETIAAHLDAEEFTEEDLEDIEQFIKFVASRKKKTE